MCFSCLSDSLRLEEQFEEFAYGTRFWDLRQYRIWRCIAIFKGLLDTFLLNFSRKTLLDTFDLYNHYMFQLVFLEFPENLEICLGPSCSRYIHNPGVSCATVLLGGPVSFGPFLCLALHIGFPGLGAPRNPLEPLTLQEQVEWMAGLVAVPNQFHGPEL